MVVWSLDSGLLTVVKGIDLLQGLGGKTWNSPNPSIRC